MSSSDLLKAAEHKMNDILLTYTERNRHDSQLHQNLIEDLKTATTEFLELRRQFFLGVGGTMLVPPPFVDGCGPINI
jgi:hypothetical protein